LLEKGYLPGREVSEKVFKKSSVRWANTPQKGATVPKKKHPKCPELERRALIKYARKKRRGVAGGLRAGKLLAGGRKRGGR